MTLGFLTITTFLLLSATALGRPFRAGEYAPGFALFFIVLGIPTGLASWTFPIYAFFVMPWWQVLVGVLIAIIGVHLVTRPLLLHSMWINICAMTFSFFGLGLVAWEVVRVIVT